METVLEDNAATNSSGWNLIWLFPPVSLLAMVFSTYTWILTDRIMLFFVAFVAGAVVLLMAEILFFWRFYHHSPILTPPKFTSSPIQLPEVLKQRLANQNLKQKEDCVWLNFLSQFLFAELRDSLNIRRFLTRKIHAEFEEILRSRSGVLMDELFLRDFNLGNTFPVFMALSVDKCDVKDDVIETLELRTHLVYDGGFQIAIDAALPFKRMAYVSVTVLKLRGIVRFRFSLHPFSHWSLSFTEDPDLELDVTAQLDGRPMPRLRNIIASQIRRIVRKKHTLPMFKMRYKPFFPPRVEPQLDLQQNIQINGTDISTGILEVTVLKATRVPFIPPGSLFYVSVSLDRLPWRQLITQERQKKAALTVELVRNTTTGQLLGMTVKDDFLPDRLHSVVLVENISVGTPAHMAGIKEGDILLQIGTNKVTDAKQATKLLKTSKEKIFIQIERQGSLMWEDDSTSRKRLHGRAASETSRLSGHMYEMECDKPYHYSLPGSTTGSATSVTDSVEVRLGTSAKKTTMKLATESTSWDQSFLFNTDPSLVYLNVCLWSHGGDRSQSSDIMSATQNDVLVGYVSLTLADIFLNCLVTLNGSFSDKVKLKHGHYKTEAELIKKWSIHKGWDPSLMYGDLVMGFHYCPAHMTVSDRKTLSSCKGSIGKLQNKLYSDKPQNELPRRLKSKQQPQPGPQELSEGHHQFESTSFVTATFCDFCAKKIWMKEAFKCGTCHMVCHKKCLVKCLVNTICTQSGMKMREHGSDVAPSPIPGLSDKEGGSRAGISNGVENIDDATTMDPDKLTTDDISVGDVDSIQNLSHMITDLYTSVLDNEDTVSQKSKEDLPHAQSISRFSVLKERSERMKDSVLKHLKKSKTPGTLSERAVFSAKQAGAQLFADMDPLLRKDKLEEMVMKLDEQLMMEMQNKETIEAELASVDRDTQSSPAKKKSDVRALQNKAVKSSEKLDAMRLLMLQYCSGLQSCINSLEHEDGSVDKGKLESHGKPSAVGGFVRRAQEKMSSIRKDFGRKGSAKTAEELEDNSQNNNRDFTSSEKGKGSNSDTNGGASRLSSSIPKKSHTLPRTTDSKNESEKINLASSLPSRSHSGIEIRISDVEDEELEPVFRKQSVDLNEPKLLLQQETRISRSSSDSGLEINKMLSLNPEDILRYRGTSLPRVLISDDDDSESDYFVMDSSDEPIVSDSSEEENDLDKTAYHEDDAGVSGEDEGDEKQHRQSTQQSCSYQV